MVLQAVINPKQRNPSEKAPAIVMASGFGITSAFQVRVPLGSSRVQQPLTDFWLGTSSFFPKHLSLGSRWHLMHQADGPEIVRKIFREQIRIRHREVTSFAPARAPRIAHGEALRFVVVVHRKNGVAADDSFSRRRHFQHACLANLRALKAVVNGEPKNKWI